MLVGKANPAVSKAFAYPYLGYKTKIACVLLVAYFVGKVAVGAAVFFEEMLRDKKSAIDDAAFLKEMPDEFLYFLGGLGSTSMFSGRSPLFEFFAGFRAQVLFYLSSGTIFIAAACIPGDGNFRFAELVAGAEADGCSGSSETENVSRSHVGRCVRKRSSWSAV